MIQITSYSVVAACLAFFYCAAKAAGNYIHYNREKKARGCGDIKAYNHYEPFFGLDFAYSLSKAFKEHRWLAWQREVHASQGVKTFRANFLGSRMIYSAESENMKAMSTSHWKEFGIEPLRRANGVIDPIGGPGVSTSDGDLWQFSRDLIKPYFTRSGYSNLGRLEVHVDKLLELVPQDGSTFDLQPLMQRWFLDTSSEFLFGETLDSLTYPERVKPSAAMIEMMRGLRVRLLLGKFLFLHRDSKWMEAVGVIRDFIDGNIDRTLAELQDCKTAGQESKRTDLLWDMARQHQDKELLRGQIIAVFVPSNDTTSILISNVFYALARNPRVWANLHEEVTALGDRPLNFELLRSMKYVNWILNETHRLYPNGIQMVRMALEDTTLPVGGGPNEQEPIFIPKGTIVSCNRYLMHRDPAIWGPNAEEFVPERWEDARPMWKFVPFGGGPRICPAHVLVATEAAYVIVRFVQRFKRIEPRDLEPYTPVMRIGPSNMHGVKIGLMQN